MNLEVIVVRNEENEATIAFVFFNLVEISEKADKRLAMQFNWTQQVNDLFYNLAAILNRNALWGARGGGGKASMTQGLLPYLSWLWI